MSDEMVNERPKTIAACTECGRGYVYMAREGVSCVDARCAGRVFAIPETDTVNDRQWGHLARQRDFAIQRQRELLNRTAARGRPHETE